MRATRFLFLILCLPPSFLLAQQSGAADYALGGSSVMWLPRATALFLNPAELSRIRQGDFSFNVGKFTRLGSFSSTMFIPSAGTFAAGVGILDSLSQYTFGYAVPFGRYHGFGIALSGFRKTEESFGMSFGVALHFPGSIENSGFHAGVSVANLSEITKSRLFSINVGGGYWFLNDGLRLQAAFQHTAVKNYGLVGMEVLPFSPVSIQVGTRSFKEVMAGLSLRFEHGSVDLSGGKAGFVFSVRAALSTPARERRDIYYEAGLDATDEERLTDALASFRRAIDYDPYFLPAVTAADTLQSILEVRTNRILAQASNLLARKDFVEATKAFSRVLRMDPENDRAREGLNSVQPRMRSYITQLITTGDSLRDRKEIEMARQSYEQAQELDPENDSLTERIESLKVLAREGVRSLLSRAKRRFDRNDLDGAQKDYDLVLESEPRNSQARQGLDAIKLKRLEAEVERGKELFALGNYMDALTLFLNVLKQDERVRDARSYVERTRQVLLPEVDNYFRSGLQFYTKENYKSALEEWDKALLINPQHQGTLEYRKRAEEKLKALERLK